MQMTELFEVVLKPHMVEQPYKNVTVTKSLNQDLVYVVNTKGMELMGHCPTGKMPGVFLPLSGVPKEIVPDIQRQINHLRGFADGEGPQPIDMKETGRTAKEQRQQYEDEDEEEYE
jgi:hypothetical protein